MHIFRRWLISLRCLLCLTCLTCLPCLICLLCLGTQTVAQTPARSREVSTQVTFEILLAPRTTGIAAQRWGPVFQQLGETARFRQPLLDDQPEVTESTRGRTRLVTAIGQLETDGSISFPGRNFRLTDTRKLTEWIRELKTYGAQGAPDGRPGFGLSAPQLELVFRTLETPVSADLAGKPIVEALAGFGLPEALPARVSADAETLLARLPAGVVAPADLRGLTRGTALAILLSRARLGFRPNRTPSGSLELLVVPLDQEAGLWPIGWPLDRPPNQAMPKYVDLIVFDLNEKPLPELLDEARRETGVRLLIDVRRIAEADLSLDAIKVTQRPRRMTWSGLLDRGTFPDLMPELLQDEAGEPFVWLTTRTVAQMNERQQQREAQLKARGK